MIKSIATLLNNWKNQEEGLASIEAGLIFPVMLMLMLGSYDLGNAILANQKAVRASQVVADLITRQNVVTEDDKDQAIEAGRLAFEPLDSSTYGVDIISIGFDEDADMYEAWRRTSNMPPVADVEASVAALAEADEGVVMVAVRYRFEPLFTGFVATSFDMQEVAFSRGRTTPVIRDQ